MDVRVRGFEGPAWMAGEMEEGVEPRGEHCAETAFAVEGRGLVSSRWRGSESDGESENPLTSSVAVDWLSVFCRLDGCRVTLAVREKVASSAAPESYPDFSSSSLEAASRYSLRFRVVMVRLPNEQYIG